MSELERRYGALLRLYPAAYRRSRGAEMLAVLMDSAAPERRRPQWREVRGLILGALRVRADAHGRRTLGHSLRVSLRTAALILLIKSAGDAAWCALTARDDNGLSLAWGAVTLAVVAVCGLAIGAVLRGAHLVAAIAAGGAFVLQLIQPDLVSRMSPAPLSYLGGWWDLPLALVLLIPLVGRGTVRVPKALNLLLLVPVVSVALDAYGTLAEDPAFNSASRYVWQALAVAAILWAVVDERVAMTFGLAFFSVVVNRALSAMSPALVSLSVVPGTLDQLSRALPDMAVLAILPVLDVAVATAIAVRRARI